MSITSFSQKCAHTDDCSLGSVTDSRIALLGGVSEVTGDGVRDALGSRALYISFFRGFPLPIRRAVVGAPGGSANDGRGGGGILVGGVTLVKDGAAVDDDPVVGA